MCILHSIIWSRFVGTIENIDLGRPDYIYLQYGTHIIGRYYILKQNAIRG